MTRIGHDRFGDESGAASLPDQTTQATEAAAITRSPSGAVTIVADQRNGKHKTLSRHRARRCGHDRHGRRTPAEIPGECDVSSNSKPQHTSAPPCYAKVAPDTERRQLRTSAIRRARLRIRHSDNERISHLGCCRLHCGTDQCVTTRSANPVVASTHANGISHVRTCAIGTSSVDAIDAYPRPEPHLLNINLPIRHRLRCSAFGRHILSRPAADGAAQSVPTSHIHTP